jgi:hypothetical protein
MQATIETTREVLNRDQGEDSVLVLYIAPGLWAWRRLATPADAELPRAERRFMGGPVLFEDRVYLPARGPNVYD